MAGSNRLLADSEKLIDRIGARWVFVASSFFTFVNLLIAGVLGTGYESDLAVPVISLQKSFTVERFTNVITSLGDDVQMLVNSIVMLDFALPVLYAMALTSALALADRPSEPHLALWLFAAPWLAALFDYSENIIHIGLLAGVDSAADLSINSFWVFAASSLAALKWLLILFSLAAIGIRGWRNGHRWVSWVAWFLVAAVATVLATT
jgi:hypothetical protein